ncbi:MAG TPA: formyltransferase family protein, partial [Chryseolinea sp.]|nr:formyltransferase family protein [Chryseolinea sp.]
MSQEFRIAIFASGGGTNAEAIIRHFKDHPLIKVALVLSNNPNALVLERAKKFAIPTRVFNKNEFEWVADTLKEYKITHIV